MKVSTGANTEQQTRTFDHDPSGLLVSEMHPENGTARYTCGARGQTIAKGPAT